MSCERVTGELKLSANGVRATVTASGDQLHVNSPQPRELVAELLASRRAISAALPVAKWQPLIAIGGLDRPAISIRPPGCRLPRTTIHRPLLVARAWLRSRRLTNPPRRTKAS